MKNKFPHIYIFILISILTLAAGCNVQEIVPATKQLTTQGQIIEEETVHTQIAEANAAQIAISDQPYFSPCGAFQITLPKEWNCSETGDFQVDCQSKDGAAGLSVSITGTAYELKQDAFLSYAHAELVHGYGDVKEYMETERDEEEGNLTTGASWREGETCWQSSDYFVRSNAAVLHVRAKAQKPVYDLYTKLFTAVRDSAVVTASALQKDAIYANRDIYTAPNAFFKLEIPIPWDKFIDATAIEKTIIEGFLSPDKRASVQIAVYEHGALITQAVKAEKTRDIIHALYGNDLRISHDKALPDGRERLSWYAKKKDINGISYFDSYGSSLYVFTILWEESTEDIYLPVLEDIEASFSRE